MGCLAIFLYPAAIWVFSKVGWITLAGEASVWKAGFWALGCIILVDLLTWGLQALVQLFSIPLSCLTGGGFFELSKAYSNTSAWLWLHTGLTYLWYLGSLAIIGGMPS